MDIIIKGVGQLPRTSLYQLSSAGLSLEIQNLRIVLLSTYKSIPIGLALWLLFALTTLAGKIQVTDPSHVQSKKPPHP